jgi:predicted thioesterase
MSSVADKMSSVVDKMSNIVDKMSSVVAFPLLVHVNEWMSCECSDEKASSENQSAWGRGCR